MYEVLFFDAERVYRATAPTIAEAVHAVHQESQKSYGIEEDTTPERLLNDPYALSLPEEPNRRFYNGTQPDAPFYVLWQSSRMTCAVGTVRRLR